MKMDRKKTSLKKMSKEPDPYYMDASPQERLSFMWELTVELWSLQGMENVERRLQRNVAKLIKQRG